MARDIAACAWPIPRLPDALAALASRTGATSRPTEPPAQSEDLDAWEKKANLKVRAGDVVFIRTGRWALRDAKGPWEVSRKSAGLHASCAKWLKSRDVAILGSDAASDVLPSGVEGVTQPIHTLVLVAMGMPIFDNCDLELIGREANRRQRWEFLLTASPMAVPGATGK